MALMIVICAGLLASITSCSTYDCLDALSCLNFTIQSSLELRCLGYASCAGTTIQETDSVWCGATKSCLGAKKIRVNKYEGTRWIWGGGYLSAAFSNVISGFLPQFSGEGSGYSIKNITVLDSGILSATGYRACDSSTIYARENTTIQGYASLSMINTKIHTSGNVIIQLYGFYAGYNATIYCGYSYSKCNLTCHSNACYNTYFVVNEDNSGYSLYCNESLGIMCPFKIVTNSNDESIIASAIADVISNATIESMVNNMDNEYGLTLDMTNYNAYDTIEFNEKCAIGGSDSYNFDSFQEKATAVLEPNKDQSICCSGCEACQSSTVIMNNADSIYLTGDFAAQYGIIAASKEDIYVKGGWGLSTGVVSGFNKLIGRGYNAMWQATTIQFGYYLTCDGYTSCSETTIKDVSNIIATGYQSLKKSTIVLSNTDDNVNGYLPMNVYLIGYDSGNGLNVEIIGDDSADDDDAYTDICTIYCAFKDACTNLYLNASLQRYCNIVYSDTITPTVSPTESPTMPTKNPTIIPSTYPTDITMSPTDKPTIATVKIIVQQNNFNITDNVRVNIEVLVCIAAIGIVLFPISKCMHDKRHHNVIRVYQIKYTSFNQDLLIDRRSTIATDTFVIESSSASIVSSNTHTLSTVLDYENGFGARPSHFAVFTILFAFIDLYSDVLFCVDLKNNLVDNKISNLFLVLFIVLLIVEIIMNCYFIFDLYTKQISLHYFSSWFLENTPYVYIIAFLSIFETQIIANIFTSQLFGYKLFYAPFSRLNISKLNKNIVYIIICVHIPQLILQVVYVIQCNDANNGTCDANFAQIFAIIITSIDLIYDTLKSLIWHCVHTSITSV